ncbi:hypothetical protein C8J57DRAFT_1222505 [Mycena rebaudengoi]|nr:hypothetical protein C8J57DRAFT_1222505 [Mycena rebaudengoi]
MHRFLVQANSFLNYREEQEKRLRIAPEYRYCWGRHVELASSTQNTLVMMWYKFIWERLPPFTLAGIAEVDRSTLDGIQISTGGQFFAISAIQDMYLVKYKRGLSTDEAIQGNWNTTKSGMVAANTQPLAGGTQIQLLIAFHDADVFDGELLEGCLPPIPPSNMRWFRDTTMPRVWLFFFFWWDLGNFLHPWCLPLQHRCSPPTARAQSAESDGGFTFDRHGLPTLFEAFKSNTAPLGSAIFSFLPPTPPVTPPWPTPTSSLPPDSPHTTPKSLRRLMSILSLERRTGASKGVSQTATGTPPLAASTTGSTGVTPAPALPKSRPAAKLPVEKTTRPVPRRRGRPTAAAVGGRLLLNASNERPPPEEKKREGRVRRAPLRADGTAVWDGRNDERRDEDRHGRARCQRRLAAKGAKAPPPEK